MTTCSGGRGGAVRGPRRGCTPPYRLLSPWAPLVAPFGDPARGAPRLLVICATTARTGVVGTVPAPGPSTAAPLPNVVELDPSRGAELRVWESPPPSSWLLFAGATAP